MLKWVLTLLSLTLLCEVKGSPIVEITANHDVGPKKCAQGPEYWCQNLVTAKSCGAVKHCIQDVWQHMSLPADKNDICDICKKMVQEARAQLQSNETQEELREVLEGTCKIYFPIKALANECIKYVDEFIPELVEMLLSRMDPQLVCATAGLCNGQAIKLRLSSEKLSQRLPTPSDCQDCKKFMQDIVTDVQESSKDEVKQKLLHVCTQLHQYARACSLVINENFDQIYDYLKNQANPEDICRLIGMCDETTNIPTITSVVELFILKNDPDPECQFCQQIVLYLKNLLTANTTEEEVKDMLLGICKQMGSLDQQCEKFINDNFDEIYDFLMDELDPKAVCSALGVCPNAVASSPWMKLMPAKPIKEDAHELHFSADMQSNHVKDAPFPSENEIEKKIHTKFPFTKIIPVQAIPENMQLPATRYFPQSLIPVKSPEFCALCEYALHEIQNMLMDNKTEEAIKHAVDKVCSILPKTLNDQCVDFINTYGDAILALLAQRIDPSVVCSRLKLCPGIEKPKIEDKLDAADLQLPASRLMPNALVASLIPSNACQICKYITTIIQTKLQDNKTKEAIEEAMKDICNDLPKSLNQRCQKFINHYGDELLMLLQTLSPDLICAAINICPNDDATKGLVPIKELKLTGCDFCEMVVDYIDKLLEEQTVEEDVTKVLEKVCDVVPKSAKDQCRTLVETYGPYILQLLAQLNDSKKVCQAIDLCSKPAGEVHLLGGNKCTYGPTYWCQSPAHAKACKAEKHCAENVWKN